MKNEWVPNMLLIACGDENVKFFTINRHLIVIAPVFNFTITNYCFKLWFSEKLILPGAWQRRSITLLKPSPSAWNCVWIVCVGQLRRIADCQTLVLWVHFYREKCIYKNNEWFKKEYLDNLMMILRWVFLKSQWMIYCTKVSAERKNGNKKYK